MKSLLNRALGRFGYELRRTASTTTGPRIDRAERGEIDTLIDRFAATQPAGSRLGDAREWKLYLSDRRLAFFQELIETCLASDVALGDADVTDVGTGTGYLLRQVARAAPRARLTGFDNFAEVLPLAESICPGATFEARSLDEISGEYDVVFCTEVLEHLVDPEGAIARMAHLLRPGGTLVLTVPDGRSDQQESGELRETGTAYWGHIHFWSPESWKLLIERTLPNRADARFGQLLGGENYAIVGV